MESAYSDLFTQVLFRALCDALGFTGESKSSDSGRRAHQQIVDEARTWFFNVEYEEDVEMVCAFSGYDPRKVRLIAHRLIEARQSGNYDNVPAYWQQAFRNGRMPSFSRYSEEIDSYLNKE